MSNASFETAFLPPPGGEWNLYLLAITWFIIVAMFSWLWVREAPDPREPPQLKPKFPLIGHLLGILQYEAEYFQKLRLALFTYTEYPSLNLLFIAPVNHGQFSLSRSSTPASTW